MNENKTKNKNKITELHHQQKYGKVELIGNKTKEHNKTNNKMEEVNFRHICPDILLCETGTKPIQ